MHPLNVIPEPTAQDRRNAETRQQIGEKQNAEYDKAYLLAPAPRPRLPKAKLEQLEQSIDESLALAKQLDREGLEDVIRLLRSARNKVVVQIGME